MRLATINFQGTEVAGIVTGSGIISMDAINRNFNRFYPQHLQEIIASGQLNQINDWYKSSGREKLEQLSGESISIKEVRYAPLYRNPKKIWGIGLNYVDHAADLAEKAPQEEPASFMKPDTTIIGPQDAIKIPLQSEKTTAESELGIIIGKECKNVSRHNWLQVVAGFTTIIDMTAEDILRKNPRYLTRSKSFDTFFSFGPQLVTPDEIEDVMQLNVATVLNGEVYAQNVVSNMTFPPDYLVSFHSHVMTLLPGDIISTGTPRAVHISDGDQVECRIDGFETLINPVIDLKRK
ncbi:MAG: fumarylacetoacetate hydrolase family protein [Bacillota bacterium]|nr:fumarylacetoacetate hydrolase family protein [Bacillota bacterium]